VPLPFDGPNIRRILLEGINVHHPAKNLGKELAACGFAFFLGGDRSVQTELVAGLNNILAAREGRNA
jgi:hypothetical protein